MINYLEYDFFLFFDIINKSNPENLFIPNTYSMPESVRGVENLSNNKSDQNPWLCGISAFGEVLRKMLIEAGSALFTRLWNTYFRIFRPQSLFQLQNLYGSWESVTDHTTTNRCGPGKKLHVQTLQFEFHKVSTYYRILFHFNHLI